MYSYNLVFGKLERIKRKVVNDHSLIYIYEDLDQSQVSNCYRYSDKGCGGDCPKLKTTCALTEARDRILSESTSVPFPRPLPSLLLGTASPR